VEAYYQGRRIKHYGIAAKRRRTRKNEENCSASHLLLSKLDGSGQYERLTYFSDYPGYKASNLVVSDDGRFIAFQMAKASEAAGVGHGIFIYDIQKAAQAKR
jgi:hypothetical protein